MEGHSLLRKGYPGERANFFSYKQFGYFCLAYQKQVGTYEACANATIGQNNIAGNLKSKSAVNSSKNSLDRPSLRKGCHIRCFKTTLASPLNREGHVSARLTAATFLIQTLSKRWVGEEGNPPTRDNSSPYKRAGQTDPFMERIPFLIRTATRSVNYLIVSTILM